MAHPLVAGIRARLKEMDEERDHLIALVALYEHPAPSQNGKTKVAPRLFQPLSGGPTDRIKAVLAREGGLTFGEVVSRALVGMNTTAGNPERSIGSTLQSLIKRGKVERRDKLHYLVKEGDNK